MNHFLGVSICFLLRHHAWRRLRKSERAEVDARNAEYRSYLPERPAPSAEWRICSRCGATRIAKRRKAA